MTDNGLITVASPFPVRETVDRLVAALDSRGFVVFARIDHADGAAKAGMVLWPTEVVIFGNPKGGTPLMQDQQTAGIDLPLKALVWEDAGRKVWLAYNDPAWLAQRHGLGASSAAALKAMEAGLSAIARAATQS
jgi:uncharacterized protein (DUF302 family)